MTTIPYDVEHGGLMRCCLASIHEYMAAQTEAPKEGDKVKCRYCFREGEDGSGCMIFKDSAWRWDHEFRK
jgi:hypothetical protein